MAAFRLAVERGADGFELDVQLTKDGEVVVFHDWALGRCVEGRGLVKHMTGADMCSLDNGSWFSPAFSKERVPRLEDVLGTFGPSVHIDIELKQRSIGPKGLEERVVAIVRRFSMEDRVMLSSFNPFVMRRIARIAPDLHRAYIYSPEQRPRILARKTGKRISRCSLMKPQDSVERAGDPEPSFCVPWTVNDASRAGELSKIQIRGVISDRPDGIMEGIGRGPHRG